MSAQASTNESYKTEHSLQWRIRRFTTTFLTYLSMSILAFFFLFPLIFMIVTSVKTSEDQITRDVAGLTAFVPYPLRFAPYVEGLDEMRAQEREAINYEPGMGTQNYRDVFARMPFNRFLFNSVLICGITVILGLLVNSMAAYALSRLRWTGQRIVLAVVIALIIIPFEAVAVPLLLLCNNLPWIDGTIGWLDSYHVQIIPFIADAFSIFLFYQFFVGLPKDLDEAALVDGASRFRTYWNLIIPISRPVIATVAILKFLQYWGSYLWPLMVTRLPEVRPLTVGMQQFFGQYPRLWGDIMAFASMITIPVLIVFMLFQKWFVQSIASSGVKG